MKADCRLKPIVLGNILILLIAIMAIAPASAQDETIKIYLKMVARGQADEVKEKLPDLLADYPNNPGVNLLHGVLLIHADKALEKYRTVIRQAPESFWADQAYWRVVQFYAMLGDTLQAKRELEKYRKAFPMSDFLIIASDVVKLSIQNERDKRPDEITSDRTVLPDDIKSDTAMTDHNQGQEPENEEPRTSGKRSFGLQVGLFSSVETAVSERNKYIQQRLKADVYEKDIDGVIMYSVVIGCYSEQMSAEEAKPVVQTQCKCIPMVYEITGKAPYNIK